MTVRERVFKITFIKPGIPGMNAFKYRVGSYHSKAKNHQVCLPQSYTSTRETA